MQNAWFAPFFRQQSSFVSDKNTKVTVQAGNALPYLWNIQPELTNGAGARAAARRARPELPLAYQESSC